MGGLEEMTVCSPNSNIFIISIICIIEKPDAENQPRRFLASAGCAC
jgi:hypothetical protein